jgi:Ca2+-transporting ATPase
MNERGLAWWQMEIPDLVQATSSSDKGLTATDAKNKLEQFGPNELVEKKRKSPVVIFINQFKDFMIVVLLTAGDGDVARLEKVIYGRW